MSWLKTPLLAVGALTPAACCCGPRAGLAQSRSLTKASHVKERSPWPPLGPLLPEEVTSM